MTANRHYINFKNLEKYFREFSPEDEKSVFERALNEDERVMLWLINDECNLHCSYCHHAPQLSPHHGLNPDEIAACFDRTAYTWFINISGGEPFIYPDFVELLQKITAKHYVSLNTNLTTGNIDEFAKKISPLRIPGINASYHAAELEQNPALREIFIQNYLKLKKNGFYIIASYVAYPPVISAMKADIASLMNSGIDRVGARNFIGIFENKKYPEYYTEAERSVIRALTDPAIELDIENKYSKMKGRFCTAGNNYLFMNKNGDLQRCTSADKRLGNFFSGEFQFLNKAEKCPADICACAFEGLLCSFNKRKHRFF